MAGPFVARRAYQYRLTNGQRSACAGTAASGCLLSRVEGGALRCTGWQPFDAPLIAAERRQPRRGTRRLPRIRNWTSRRMRGSRRET